MRLRSLDQALQDARIPYTAFRHPPAFTAQREAAVSHVPGWSWAKVVVCFADDELVLAVVPAPLMVDLDRLRVLSGAGVVRLAHEHEFAARYPDCEPGAVPPFGNQPSPRVFLERSLVGEVEMVLNAGTHTDAIRMDHGDFAALTQAIVGAFGRPAAEGRT